MDGIREALNDMAFGPDRDDTSEFQPALDKAEKWHLTLEEMGEVANEAERVAISILIDACKRALGDLLEKRPAER